MNRLKTFVRYDVNGIIVPGSAISAKTIPKTGKWGEVSLNTLYGNSVHNGLKAYIQYTKEGNFIPSSNILAKEKPRTGKWKQINIQFGLDNITTTTTTTTNNPILPDHLILTYDGLGVIFSEDGTKVLTFNGFQPY